MTLIVFPTWAATSGEASRSRSRENASFSIRLVNRLRTWTGAPSSSSFRKTWRKTPTKTASFMVDAAWKNASPLYDHCMRVSES